MASAGRASKRERHRSEQRERILDAARLLLANRGLDGVTMDEVAKRAGVARATAFNYFPSKNALVAALSEGVLAHLLALLESALADGKTPTPTLVRALFDEMGRAIEQVRSSYRGVFREIVTVQVGLDEGRAARRTREAALALLERLVERGQARGELTTGASAGDLACAFDSLANGAIVHWLGDETSGSLRERMLRAAEIFLGPVAVDAEAARGRS